MSLADEARALTGTAGYPCGVARLLATLDPQQQTEVREAFAREDISASAIARAIKARGWQTVSDQTIKRHRSKTCRCES